MRATEVDTDLGNITRGRSLAAIRWAARRVSDDQRALFWSFGVLFWIVASLLGRRAMRSRVADGTVTQREVDEFARGFAALLGGLSLVSALASFVGGPLGYRLLALAWSLGSVFFLFWLWRFNGASQLVRFGPFLNMPLKRESVVRIVATVLATAAAIGNLSAAIFTWAVSGAPPNKALQLTGPQRAPIDLW